MYYSEQTGIPLNLFALRCLQLKAPGQQSPPPGGFWEPSDTERCFSYDQLLHLVKKEGLTYRKSFPGDSARASNFALSDRIQAVVGRNVRPPLVQLEELYDQIHYCNTEIMAAATIYKDYLGVSMSDCADLDMQTRPYILLDFEMWQYNSNLVASYPLFEKPRSSRPFLKGHECCE